MNGDMDQIRVLEEKTLNAWAPLRRIVYDGWFLGFSEGFTRRANCVHVIYPSSTPVEEKVAKCEAAFEVRGLPVVFKISPIAEAQKVEETLDQNAYEKEATTLVQTLTLEPLPRPTCEVDARRTLNADWMVTYADLKALTPRDTVLTEAIIRQAVGHARFVTLYDEGEAVASGFCSLEGSHVGLFGLVTHPTLRRRGYGTQLVQALLNLAYSEGARTAYLQVEATNHTAIGLYDKFGFREAYRYWYRVKHAA